MLTRSFAAYSLLASFFFCSGCFRAIPAAHEAELQEVAWYIEDRSRGIARDPRELQREDMSPAHQQLVLWLSGAVINGAPTGSVAQINGRTRRWPMLKSAMAQGLIISDETGLLMLRKLPPDQANDIPEDFLELLPGLIANENRDRLELCAIMINQSGYAPSSLAGRSLLWQLHDLRHKLDSKQGAQSLPPPIIPAEEKPEPQNRRWQGGEL